MIDLRNPLTVLSTRSPWAATRRPWLEKLVHLPKPAKRVIREDLAGAYAGKLGGGVSPAGRRDCPSA